MLITMTPLKLRKQTEDLLSSLGRDWSADKKNNQGERYKTYYQYARDYAYEVFKRYESWHGHLNSLRAEDKLRQIMARYWWRSNAHLHLPHSKTRLFIPQGPFCPIGPVGYQSKEGGYHKDMCPICGNGLYYKGGSIEDASHYSSYYSSFDIRYFQTTTKCLNKFCCEVSAFLKGHHDISSAAKQLGIKANRPLKKIKNATPEEAYALGAAALLDYEARYISKLNEQKNTVR